MYIPQRIKVNPNKYIETDMKTTDEISDVIFHYYCIPSSNSKKNTKYDMYEEMINHQSFMSVTTITSAKISHVQQPYIPTEHCA